MSRSGGDSGLATTLGRANQAKAGDQHRPAGRFRHGAPGRDAAEGDVVIGDEVGAAAKVDRLGHAGEGNAAGRPVAVEAAGVRRAVGIGRLGQNQRAQQIAGAVQPIKNTDRSNGIGRKIEGEAVREAGRIVQRRGTAGQEEQYAPLALGRIWLAAAVVVVDRQRVGGEYNAEIGARRAMAASTTVLEAANGRAVALNGINNAGEIKAYDRRRCHGSRSGKGSGSYKFQDFHDHSPEQTQRRPTADTAQSSAAQGTTHASMRQTEPFLHTELI